MAELGERTRLQKLERGECRERWQSHALRGAGRAAVAAGTAALR